MSAACCACASVMVRAAPANVVQQWTEAAHQAQQATLEVWQASIQAGDRLLASAESDELSRPEDKGKQR